MTSVSQRLLEVALERSLRASTVRSYRTLLERIGFLVLEDNEITREQALEAVWTIENVNTRRATVIAIRSVLAMDLKIPRGVPRRYDLPDETTLRLALSLTPHQVRGELMAFAGLRVGEAAAITRRDVHGDRLTVDKQISELSRQVAPVKSAEASIIIPVWLAERLDSVTDTAQPASIRESLRRAGHKVGIHLSPHQLRHWYATTLLSRGVPLITVSRQMRHSDVSVTLRTYAQADDARSIHDAFS